jgi:hypothetical protein
MARYILLGLLTFTFYVPLWAKCIKGDCFNGKGTYISTRGNKYIGQWKKGQKSGEGKLIFSTGDYYIGQFSEDTFNGKGEFYFKTGEFYKGNWLNGKSHGEGEYYFENGNRYVGNFKNGMMHGHGVFYYEDGSRYEGAWEENHKQGLGTLFFPNGIIKSGTWVKNELLKESMAKRKLNQLRNCNAVDCSDGIGYFTFEDGSRWEGEFAKGIPHGRGKCFYANGDVYIGEWKKDGPHGKGKINFASGRTYTGQFNNGVIHQNKLASIQNNHLSDLSGKQKNKKDSGSVDVYAMIVGVANYNHLSALKYPDDDAYQLYAFLKSPEGGALKDERIHLLIDDAATRQNIIANLNNILSKTDENDVLLLYMSGHGLKGSFAPFDYDGYQNSLAYEDLMTAFNQGKARHKLFIADACHSGSMANEKSAFLEGLSNFYKRYTISRPGAAVMMSSKPDEVSLEYGGLRQGVFTYYFIRGLKGYADFNRDKVVTIGELHRYIEREVKSYSNNAQNPSMIGDYDPAMPISWIP